MSTSSNQVLYQLKAVIAGISPMIWRGLLVLGDTTIAQLHYILQIAFGWTDYYLHRFVIQAKLYGISRIGSDWFSDDANILVLDDLGLRVRERFLYQYNFFDNWQVQLRVEAISKPEPGKPYPRCIAGKHSGPIEDCGGSWAFQELHQEFSDVYVAGRLAQMILNGEINHKKAELHQLSYWLYFEKLDLAKLNHRLQRSPLSEDCAFREEVIYVDL
jgi:hypothetical protein